MTVVFSCNKYYYNQLLTVRHNKLISTGVKSGRKTGLAHVPKQGCPLVITISIFIINRVCQFLLLTSVNHIVLLNQLFLLWYSDYWKWNLVCQQIWMAEKGGGKRRWDTETLKSGSVKSNECFKVYLQIPSPSPSSSLRSLLSHQRRTGWERRPCSGSYWCLL